MRDVFVTKRQRCPRESDILEIFHNFGGPKDKMLEGNPNLGSSCQDIEKILSSYCKSLDHKTSTAQTLLGKYFTKK